MAVKSVKTLDGQGTQIKPRVLFLIGDDVYVRNYLRTDALADVRRNTDLAIVAKADLSLIDEIRATPEFVKTFSVEPRMARRHRMFFELLMWRYRRRSKTFLYRWMRIANWDLIQPSLGLGTFIKSTVRWALNSSGNVRALRSPLLGNRFVFPFVGRLIEASLVPNPELADAVRNGAYDLLIFPSSANDPAGADLVRLGQKHGVPTLALIDNWDNLSSKTIFWRKPNHLAVWGEQTREQAVNIHGCPSASVHLLGTPRFDVYLSKQEVTLPDNTPRLPANFLLFVGSAMPFDEISALSRIDEVLDKEGRDPDLWRILYRPHPWQQKRRIPQEFEQQNFRYVELDPQMAARRLPAGMAPARDSGFQPDLNYYPTLLSSALVVIGPLTTMLFEAALCNRPVLALSYDDGHHFNTSRRYFSHFDGLEAVPGFVFCDQQDQLDSLLAPLMNHPKINPQLSREVTQRYIFSDERPYRSRLLDLVTGVLDGR
jgi:hypothetical protein